MEDNIKFDKNGNQVCTWQYNVIRALGKFVHKFIFPIKVHGMENINIIQAPYIIISNHKSMLDPIAIAINIKKYPVHFLGKKELTKNNSFANLLKKLYMIPVDRKNTDIRAIRECLSVLKNNGIIGIFPEGTRHKEGVMEDLEGGTSMLVLKSGVPVMPVLIKGKLKLFKKTNVYYGKPIEYHDIMAKGVNATTCELFTQRLKIYYKDIEKTL